MFWMDEYYFILVIPAMLLALWAQIKVKGTFHKYNQYQTSKGYTAAKIARRILDHNGLQNVRIELVSGELSDNFDPRINVVHLSDKVYNSTSVGAIGVAAHECGHAVQYAQHYTPVKIRSAMIPVTNIGSQLGIPLAVIGFIAGLDMLVNIGIILFLAVVLFQLVTLPVEFNASARAIKTLDSEMILDEDELRGAKKVLTAAALTYVAALVVAFANLFRLILLRNRNRN